MTINDEEDGICNCSGFIPGFPIISNHSSNDDLNSTNGKFNNNNTTSINQIVDFHLYPNPTKGSLFLNLKEMLSQNGSIQIYNSFGQKVKGWDFENLANDVKELNLANLNNGVYLISIQFENHKMITKKFVVSK